MTDIVKRLRAYAGPFAQEDGFYGIAAEAADEIERLTTENADLRRWKALDKPLTAAMAIVVTDMQQLRADIAERIAT